MEEPKNTPAQDQKGSDTGDTNPGEGSQEPKSVEESIADLKKQNEDLFARTKQAEEENKKYRDQMNKFESMFGPQEQKTEEKKEFDPKWQEKVDFLMENKEFSKEELTYVDTIAKGAGISLGEAAQRDDVKEYISFQRERKRSQEKIPAPESRSVTYKGKSLKEMSNTKEGRKELKDNWGDVVSGFKNRSKSKI